MDGAVVASHRRRAPSFHGTRTPLTVWFVAVWQMTSQKYGISALGLKRVLGIGSEQTAWAMLHRYRTAMVRPGRDRLGTIVEVDETVQACPTCQPRRRAPRPPVAPPVKPDKPINPHRLH